MGTVIFSIGAKSDEECDKCKGRNQKVIKAQPSDPFDGTSCIDLECLDCGHQSYHWTEGHVEAEGEIKYASSVQRRGDPVSRLICDLSAEEMTDWLIEYKGLEPSSRDNVISNLREQFRWHRLQGRLDRYSFLSALAELLRLKRSAKTIDWRTEI